MKTTPPPYPPSRAPSVVQLENVSKHYRLGNTVVSALKSVALKVPAGAFLCVAGPSGSGKTTLLNLIGCIDQPDEGTLSLAGVEVTKLSDRALTALRLKTLGFIFQSFNLVPVLSVFQNVELPLLLLHSHSALQRRSRVMSLLEKVGLADLHSRRPAELSGGQRQRVAVARALVNSPRVVLADEPTANLDSVTGQRITDLLRTLNRTEGTTFLFSTHDPMVMAQADFVLRLSDGSLVSDAPSVPFLSDRTETVGAAGASTIVGDVDGVRT